MTSVIVLIGSLCAAPVIRADGMLDPSFGNGGLVTTNFPGVLTSDVAYSLVVLPDGRAVAAGSSYDFDADTLSMAVVRYLPSGARDTSFSGDGMTTVSPPIPLSFPCDGAAKVLLQPDGRVVLIGACAGPSPEMRFWLARLNADGSLDQSFGTGGQLVTPFGTSVRAVSGVLQPDGRIVAVGHTVQDPAIVAARYNVDGSLDPTFAAGGQLNLPLPQSFVVGDVVLQSDAKFVIGGTYGAGDFGLVRLLPDGALDPSFDGDGLATANFGRTETGKSVIVLSDGRLVLGGSHNTDFGLVRFLAGGSVDATFGTGGLATASDGINEVTPDEVIRLPNGNLVIAGSINIRGAPRDFLLARFLAEGALDTTFGIGGFLRTDFAASEDSCYAVALAGPDLILTAGLFAGGSPFSVDFALARYIASTPVELLAFEVE